MSIFALRQLAERLQATPTLAGWLQLYAALTWTKTGFIKDHPPLRLHETTITQNLVFDCWLAGCMQLMAMI